jgi:hypothetical protein
MILGFRTVCVQQIRPQDVEFDTLDSGKLLA